MLNVKSRRIARGDLCKILCRCVVCVSCNILPSRKQGFSPQNFNIKKNVILKENNWFEMFKNLSATTSSFCFANKDITKSDCLLLLNIRECGFARRQIR
jgi:hypothetical protein